MEIMRDVPNFEGKYALTRDGKLWAYPNNTHKGKYKVPQKNPKGDCFKYVLWKEGKAKSISVNHLIELVWGDSC